MLHYFARNFFAAVLPVGFEDDGVMHIYAVSDLSGDATLWAVVRCPGTCIPDMLRNRRGEGASTPGLWPRRPAPLL